MPKLRSIFRKLCCIPNSEMLQDTVKEPQRMPPESPVLERHASSASGRSEMVDSSEKPLSKPMSPALATALLTAQFPAREDGAGTGLLEEDIGAGHLHLLQEERESPGMTSRPSTPNPFPEELHEPARPKPKMPHLRIKVPEPSPHLTSSNDVHSTPKERETPSLPQSPSGLLAFLKGVWESFTKALCNLFYLLTHPRTFFSKNKEHIKSVDLTHKESPIGTFHIDRAAPI